MCVVRTRNAHLATNAECACAESGACLAGRARKCLVSLDGGHKCANVGQHTQRLLTPETESYTKTQTHTKTQTYAKTQTYDIYTNGHIHKRTYHTWQRQSSRTCRMRMFSLAFRGRGLLTVHMTQTQTEIETETETETETEARQTRETRAGEEARGEGGSGRRER